ncbi:MFS transporter [Aeromonas caviae]|nr:MFS transporter [Aeromonas caviae]GJA89576.1 MFS transporter [Aeromonas caviae]GJB06409.1 MFS transporter [Aeromonas caviae]GJB15443.1 MFS transporter [Aeromonas caviae]GJB27560.1 MFS transporter [Aeromonas caviae]
MGPVSWREPFYHEEKIMSTSPSAGGAATPGPSLLFAMALSCGLAVANIYYNQPMLAVMAQDFPGHSGMPLIAMLTQLGYAMGLLLLVPLGDVVERRWLIPGQFALIALASLLAATAASATTLMLASVLLGIGATAAQQIVPVAATLADPARRGAVVGSVMSGLLAGILLSRTVAGLVTAYGSWRAMFWLAIPLALSGALLMARMIPSGLPRSPLGYGRLLHSLVGLWREEPALRRATLTQALLFASFSAFWTVLAFYLAEPAYGLGARPVVLAGAVLVVLAWICFELWLSLAGLACGVILLDLGVQSALIAHQQRIYGLRPEARGRINTLFMTGMFLGGTLGSSLGMLVWQQGHWIGVGAAGMGLALVACLCALAGRRGLQPAI